MKGHAVLHGLERAVISLVPVTTAVLVTVPLIYVFVASFTSGPPGDPTAHFTLSKWQEVYTGAPFLEALWNSLELGLTVAVFSTLLGFILAWIAIRTDTPGRKYFDVAMLFPLYLSPLILALAWVALGSSKVGYVNILWRQMFDTSGPLMNIYSYGGIVFVLVLHFVPHAYLIIGSNLASLPRSLEEASQTCRASSWQTLRYITVPMLLPAILASLIQVGVFSAEQFSVPFYLGISQGFETVPSQVYLAMARYPTDYNVAAATGTMLLWFTVTGVIVYRYMISRSNQYATLSGKGDGAYVKKLGWAKYLAAGLMLVYLLAAVVLPLLALLWGSLQSYVSPVFTLETFSLKHWEKLLTDDTVFGAIKNSLLLGTVGATATLLFCLLISYVSLRTRALGRTVADYLSTIPMSMPGIVLALGFLWFYVRSPLPLYGTLFGLGLAYAIRFMGHGVRMTSTGLLQVHTELLEAARMNRAGPLRTIKDILLPLLRPHLVSAWMILFVLFILELNITILLYRSSSRTMSVYIWSQLDTLSQSAAYPVSLLQCLIVAVVLFVVARFKMSIRVRAAQ